MRTTLTCTIRNKPYTAVPRHIFVLRTVPLPINTTETCVRTISTSPLLILKITAQYNRSIALTLAEVDSRNVRTDVTSLVA